MTKDELITQVLHILNEAGSIDGTEMIGADMTMLNTQIEKLFPAAYRRAFKIFRRSWFVPTSFKNATKVTNAPDGTGYVILPSNYLELVSFKMQGWKSTCLEAPEETPAINRKQQNEYLRGTPERPVCVLRLVTHENALQKALYYYSLPRQSDDSGHVVEEAQYIGVQSLNENIDIPEQLFEPLAYLVASAVLTTFEKTTQADKIEAEILKMI